MSFGEYLDHFGIFRIFWWFQVYVSYFKGFKSILVFPRYFEGSGVILIILEVLGLFFRFRDYFGHFGVSGVFWSI
jgi:hypothetical protein